MAKPGVRSGDGETPWSSWRGLGVAERRRSVSQWAGLDASQQRALGAPSGLPAAVAAQLIENAVGTYPLPLGLALHLVVDGTPVVAPMAVEESSVVAAASHGAKMAAAGGGFRTEIADPVAIGQVEVRGVRDPAAALRAVRRSKAAWMERLDGEIPSMVRRGGGLRDVTARDLGGGRVVVHLHVDTRDAMGANLVNTLCESIADDVAAACKGRRGLRILSNLADGRLATAWARIPAEAVGGPEIARAIVEANGFALADPYRAATHNKGILNGIDPLLVATGNDWRAVEAGAHAWAARDGQYRALTSYRFSRGSLEAELTLPMAVGTVGGATAAHPVAAACRHILGDPDAKRLAAVAVSLGLAQNLAALRALSAEGIQEGHMALHGRALALQSKAQAAAKAGPKRKPAAKAGPRPRNP